MRLGQWLELAASCELARIKVEEAKKHAQYVSARDLTGAELDEVNEITERLMYAYKMLDNLCEYISDLNMTLVAKEE